MNKSSLSANTLFHFTDKLDNMVNILVNEFAPAYCMESFNYLSDETSPMEIAIPMICFCDIQLSHIRNHIKSYGGYAIGLSKKWGVSKGINPVMYCIPNSFSTEIIKQSIKIINTEAQVLKELESACKCSEDQSICALIEKLKNSTQQINALNVLQFNFTNYMKPYEGCSWSENAFCGDTIRFYDEREWRFIPAPDLLQKAQLPTYLTKEQYLGKNFKNDLNNKMKEVSKLSFKPNDIKYIIVNSQDEILNICNQIDYIKGDRYSQDEIQLLKTRIISTEQIIEDF